MSQTDGFQRTKKKTSGRARQINRHGIGLSILYGNVSSCPIFKNNDKTLIHAPPYENDRFYKPELNVDAFRDVFDSAKQRHSRLYSTSELQRKNVKCKFYDAFKNRQFVPDLFGPISHCTDSVKYSVRGGRLTTFSI